MFFVAQKSIESIDKLDNVVSSFWIRMALDLERLRLPGYRLAEAFADYTLPAPNG